MVVRCGGGLAMGGSCGLSFEILRPLGTLGRRGSKSDRFFQPYDRVSALFLLA